MSESFQKFDDAKPRYDLIPPKILDEVAQVLTFGAQKYDDENWHKCDSQRRYFSAAMRHLWAWARGETDDPETSLSHVAHAICCLLFMGELDRIRPETDDRAKAYQCNE